MSGERQPVQDKPQDLSMKGVVRKVKHIPPPLDLNARTIDRGEFPPQSIPKSPSELPRECLPIRKRPLVEVRKDLVCKSPKSAGCGIGSYYYAPSSPLGSAPARLPVSSSALTPSSANSHASAFTQFPLPPPPLISQPAVIAAAAAAVGSYPKSPYLHPYHGFPTPPTDLHSPYAWSSPLFSPFSSYNTSALLSPAPSSYPSSTNSSREDLPPLGSNFAESESKRRLLTSGYGGAGGSAAPADSSSPVPSSPLLSPRTWSHSWPTPIWQCFVAGTLVKFLLPNLDTPWQKVEELNWKDRMAMKVDSKNSYQYAPDGLTIVKIDAITREYSREGTELPTAPKPASAVEVSTLLRLRMAPHRGDNSPEILVECTLDHPFFVKEKGWSSGHARMSIEKYGIPCQELSVGDICLPPNHPEAVRTPDLCDRFRRFEFSGFQEEKSASSPPSPKLKPTSAVTSSGDNQKLSPPMSPAKLKKEKDPDKPKRPMNGFMLFAKKYRLELIQQHPGKDNRAISVLLGEAWKSLPQPERESYSMRAKVLADEQKKMYPDCWKRKRTLTNGGTPTTPASQPGTPTLLGSQTQQFFPPSSTREMLESHQKAFL